MDNNFEILNKLLAKYGWTAEEAMENINKASQALANYYMEGSAQVKDVLNQVYNLAVQARPDTDAKTENPNEKSLLDFSKQNSEDNLNDILNISADDDWIKEALNGDIEI